MIALRVATSSSRLEMARFARYYPWHFDLRPAGLWTVGMDYRRLQVVGRAVQTIAAVVDAEDFETDLTRGVHFVLDHSDLVLDFRR